MDKKLFIKYLNNECSPEEVNKVIDWFRLGSGCVVERSMVQKVWDELELSVDSISPDEFEFMLDKIHHRINMNASLKIPEKGKIKFMHKMTVQKIFTVLTRVAAVLFVPVFFTILYLYSTENFKSKYIAEMIELKAPAGSVVHTKLPDGTEVWVNQKSTLKYPEKFEKNSRNVYLVGEAYFAVEEDKERPFITTVHNIEVKAMGTDFNVKFYPEDLSVETSLVSGSVVVQLKSAAGTKSGQAIVMFPGQHMSLDLSSNTYRMKRDYMENYVSWKDDKLVFREASLKLILNRLGNWYNIEFVILNKEIENLTYTATFIDETLPQILNLLEKAAPVKFNSSAREKLADGSYSKSKVYVSNKR